MRASLAHATAQAGAAAAAAALAPSAVRQGQGALSEFRTRLLAEVAAAYQLLGQRGSAGARTTRDFVCRCLNPGRKRHGDCKYIYHSRLNPRISNLALATRVKVRRRERPRHREAAVPMVTATRLRLKRELGLQWRIMFYVALGSLALVGFFAFVSHSAMDEATTGIFSERLYVARLVAAEVADRLEPGADPSELRVSQMDQVAAILTVHSAIPRVEGTNLRLTLWDGYGNVVAATAARVPDLVNREHQRLLGDFMARREPTVVVHRPQAAPDRAHVVAFAPLPGLPGGILLEQSEDAALGMPRALLHRLSILGLLFLLAGMALAWLTTRQVVGPLVRLTEDTARITAGDLSTPVSQAGQDEVRYLARSFETMRRQLQESHAQLADANRELEHRVQERTAELELRNSQLTAASRLLQERENERTFLLQKTIQAQEEERRRVARELHDVVGQFLFAQAVEFSVAEGEAQAVAPHLAARLAGMRTATSRMVGEVRRLTVDLRPELLDDLGLAAALDWYAEQVLQRQGIRVALDVDALDHRLPAQAEVVVFRVMQEAITNILKHARASQVRVALKWDGERLAGTVEDDGQGFDTVSLAGAHDEGGIGLLGMRERVALLGGSLQIFSAPGRGTRLIFRVPVEGRNSHDTDPDRSGR